MDYDFGKFIEKAKNDCRTKSDFISMIDKEKGLISEINNGQSSLQREMYSQRLDNAKFCVQNRVMKMKDQYNDDLRKLLDGLR